MDIECPRCLGAGSLWGRIDQGDEKYPRPRCSLCAGEGRLPLDEAVQWRLGLVECGGYKRETVRKIVAARGTAQANDYNFET